VIRRLAPGLQGRRRFIAIAILLTGFVSALVVYVTARPTPANPLGYEPTDSKQYLRQMEVYGGKANLLASELRQWFDSLWHGRRLAATVVCLFLYLVGSTPLPPDVAASLDRDQKGDRPGQ
jgi:hypothetical protein